MKLLNIVTPLHEQTQRNYIKRMLDQKIDCMQVAKKYDFDYWDGDRRFGYGGYKYIPGRWTGVAKSIIEQYSLNNNSKILDIGCGKGYLLHEIKSILPGAIVLGIDISKYAIEHSHESIKNFLSLGSAFNLPFSDMEFDLAISLAVFHNLKNYELKKSLFELNRVARNKYLMVESFRNNEELFNLQCWALTAETFLSKKEWEWIFMEYGYNGDYEFIYFS
jgi:ubiquinone/menaquinone biosynthesis C-methylase UbiE